MIRIIHISDFHLINENINLSQKNILKALINDLKTYIEEEFIIVFSGDFVDKSGLSFKDKENRFIAFKKIFIDYLNNAYPSTIGKIFIVPGNHDFDRTEIDEFTGLPFRDSLLKDPKIVNNYIESVKKGNKKIDGLRKYKEFEKKYYDLYYDDTNWLWSQYDNSFKIEINNISVGISAFNSSWLCYQDDNIEKLFLGENQVESSINFIKDCQVKIAIMHHPFEFYHKEDIEKTKPLLYNNYNMVFVGHTHKLESKQIDDLDGNLFISVGKSICGQKTKDVNFICGYSIIDYYHEDKITVTYKKYIDNKSVFVLNTDIGNDNGVKEFPIPKSNELEIYTKSKSIIELIKEEHFPKLNDDLILNISQSNKSSLSEIFVEPIIGNLPESNLSEQEEIEYYSSEDLSKCNGSKIIFGAKETGKTILLNKILINYTENYTKNQRIPILIKFNDLGNRSIKQIIRDFIFKSSEETRSILDKIPVDLLIDNIDFNEDYKYQLKELKTFINEYPNTNIIATHIHYDESQIPFKIITEFSNYVSGFNTYYLHFFKSKQIKGLISNWICSSELDVHQNIEKLLKGFSELGLPKTPLAVTLFLWIINKQQKKPINNAVLVEMFIDNLLEKSDIKNIYFDTFDFDDKQRLLSFVAKYMLENGNKNLSYSVNEFDLLKFIEKYLKLKMDINPRKVFEYFIDRGILIRFNGSSVRFKTAFFFSYFVAKYISYDSEFKSEVFSENNYLEFINEIDFYTGLNREDDKVFDFVNEELLKTFNFINPKVKDDYNQIDEVLETEQTISSKIDLTKVNNKPTEQQLEEVYDSQISSIQPNQKIEPKKDFSEEENKDVESDSPSLSKVLKLASVVLKNSTDIDPVKRKKAYDEIILSSISFMLVYRDAILYFYKNKREEVVNYIPKKMNFGFFMQVLPIIHQVTMYNWIGSLKTAPIIRKKILEDQNSINISEFEKFLSVYIYSDIRGRDYIDYINENFKNSRKRYILDGIFIKNISYYYLRSKTPESDLRNTKLLAEVKIKLKEVTKRGKGKYIQKLKEKKMAND